MRIITDLKTKYCLNNFQNVLVLDYDSFRRIMFSYTTLVVFDEL